MHSPFDRAGDAAALDDLDASDLADLDGWVGELTAARAAELRLCQRLAPAVGGPIRVRLAPCPEIEGTLMRVGRDHLWLADPHGYWLLVTAELDALSVRQGALRPAPSFLEARGLASAMRELVGIGRSVAALVGDRWIEGTLTLVGADFLEIDGLTVPLRRVRAGRVWY